MPGSSNTGITSCPAPPSVRVSIVVDDQAQVPFVASRPTPKYCHNLRKPVSPKFTPITMPQPKANSLLAALPEAEFQRLAPHLEPFALPLSLALYESHTQLTHVYFPTDGIVSLLNLMEDGSSAEIAVIGNEGIVGDSLFLGGRSVSRAVVQSSGHAYRVRAGVLMQEFERGGFLMNLLLRFTQTLIAQMAQTAVCNRHHSIDQQLCRWLLLSLDRLPGNEIRMTQELIANMLGVRREGVTGAASQMRSAGLIAYRRGLITVLQRSALEKRVCECYTVVKREANRLLPRREQHPAQASTGLRLSA